MCVVRGSKLVALYDQKLSNWNFLKVLMVPCNDEWLCTEGSRILSFNQHHLRAKIRVWIRDSNVKPQISSLRSGHIFSCNPFHSKSIFIPMSSQVAQTVRPFRSRITQRKKRTSLHVCLGLPISILLSLSCVAALGHSYVLLDQDLDVYFLAPPPPSSLSYQRAHGSLLRSSSLLAEGSRRGTRGAAGLVVVGTSKPR
jgi:hypothetical protein